MSPYLFAIHINDVASAVEHLDVGCKLGLVSLCIVLYADDILLLAPSVSSLQTLFSACEAELANLDLAIYSKKTVCVRIGPRFNVKCCNIVTADGTSLTWVDKIRYLGVFIVNNRQFRCSFDSMKSRFNRSFNAIYGKIGRTASHDVILKLVESKCLPTLLYGVDVVPVSKTDLKSVEFTFNRALMKIFRTSSMSVIQECMSFFGLGLLSLNSIVNKRKSKFLWRYLSADKFFVPVFF